MVTVSAASVSLIVNGVTGRISLPAKLPVSAGDAVPFVYRTRIVRSPQTSSFSEPVFSMITGSGGGGTTGPPPPMPASLPPPAPPALVAATAAPVPATALVPAIACATPPAARPPALPLFPLLPPLAPAMPVSDGCCAAEVHWSPSNATAAPLVSKRPDLAVLIIVSSVAGGAQLDLKLFTNYLKLRTFTGAHSGPL